jgi:iron complex outermembrane receptor protein
MLENKSGYRIAFFLASLTAAAPGIADVAAVEPNASDSLDEVVVTARRRDESIEKVPLAITAFGTDQLAARQITTEADLQAATPGLTVRQTSSQNQLNYSIRGQSVDAFSGSSPGVLPYIDEVQVSANTSTAFFDLQSVQVLKGPQGTLFGRNATGGAVLYESQKPTNDFGGYIEARLGNYDTREYQGALNLPIVDDKVLLRVAGLTLDSRGYVHNLYDGGWLGGDATSVGRVSLTLKPVDGLDNTSTFQYGHFGGTNAPTQLYSANACGSTNNGIPLLSSVACLYNPAFPGFAAFLAAHPNAYPGGAYAFVAYQKSLGPWNANVDFPAEHDANAGFFINNTAYDVDPDLKLKNIFGYTHSRSSDQNDFDGTNYPIFAAGSESDPKAEVFRVRQVSDELQVQGKAFDDALNFLAGAYYSYEQDQDDYPLVAFDLSPVIPGTPVRYHWQITDRSRALFTQETVALGGGFSLTAGLRETWEDTGIDQLNGSIFEGANSEQQSARKPSWNLSVEYQATPDLLIYAATRGSWRNGGFNGTSPALFAYSSGGGNVFKPETTRDVELGAKFSGRVLDMPVRLNVAAYNQWVDDIQRTAYLILDGNPLAITVNVPRAKITGLEADGEIHPLPWLQVGGSLSYADARYTDSVVSYFGNTLAFGPYGDTPRWSGVLYAQATESLPGHWGDVSLRGDYYVQSTQYFSNLNSTINPGTELPSYNLVNLRLDWSKIHDTGLTAGLYVRNLTNKEYYVGGIPQGADLGLNQASPGRPRTFGLDLKYSF